LAKSIANEMAGMQEQLLGIEQQVSTHRALLAELTSLKDGGMSARMDRMETKIDSLVTGVAAFGGVKEDVEILNKAVFGNGKTGLEKDVDRIKWAFAIAVFILTTGAGLLTACNRLGTLGSWTPPPPQETAGAINSTLIAQATQTARPIDAPTLTATSAPGSGGGAPLDEPTPTQSIIETGTPIAASTLTPNTIMLIRGIYVSTDGEGQYVYVCPRTTCEVAYWLRVGVPKEVYGWLVDSQRRIWRCLDYKHVGISVTTDCRRAVLHMDGQKSYGDYTALPERKGMGK
jgi:hypothetical protein